VRACIRAIYGELNAAPSEDGFPRFRLIVDVTRNFGVESAMRSVELAVESTDVGVIGIGLGGDEMHYPPELFTDAFAFARANGLHCVAHAGEAAGPESIRNALEYLHVERIGHGIRALEDPALMRILADRAIPLEVCPTSNALTGVVAASFPHPILELDAAGCVVVVDADDPAIFRTSITQEYGYVIARAGEATMARFVANAIAASFTNEQHKVKMLKQLAHAIADDASAPRLRAAPSAQGDIGWGAEVGEGHVGA